MPDAVNHHLADHEEPIDLLRYIRESVIGRNQLVDGPFGQKPVIYADYTASGRSLSFVEQYISEIVLPLYANTHTESSGTGLQTTRFREEARAIIRQCVGADDSHVVLFGGNGATYAISKLIRILGLAIPSEAEDRWHLSSHIPAEERPVVFIGPYEHHSNEIPWREGLVDVITIDEDFDGHIDLDQLESQLEAHADRPLLIGSFSAASNVTGILSNTKAVSSLLHRHGALSFWDYAAAAPYVHIEMGSADNQDGAYIDAVFISPHKFIGGPGTPGVLVARRELFANRVPDIPGGGTVRYVNPTDHAYLDDIEHREEGGTPAIVESIRAGLVFQLKERIGVDQIQSNEHDFIRRAITSWEANPRIHILGNADAERLSIVSFTIGDADQHLHHNFVVAVLSDLFGIQSRGGCSCAGPYGHRLLGINLDRSHEFECEITKGHEGIKPGWVRVSFNYFIDDPTFNYILSAVHLVADHGARLLPYYRFEPESGLWRHRDPVGTPPMSLDSISYDSGRMEYPQRPGHESGGNTTLEVDLGGYLAAGHEILLGQHPDPLDPPTTTDDFEKLRWFLYPADLS